MNKGIVGHEAAKFTSTTELWAREIIRKILKHPRSVCVSGECPLGGIDIWAKEEAEAMGRDYIGHPPAENNWEYGYKPRNLRIARDSDVVHVIVVRKYPRSYQGMRFDYCYHCDTNDHIKSGGCWTARQALKMGKRARWHVI